MGVRRAEKQTGQANLKPSVPMLREIQLLGEFDDVELAHLVAQGECRHYEAHSNIVIEGEQSWGLYLILDGAVGVFKRNKLTGQNYDLAQLRKGNFFGEMSLIDRSPRSASVKALTGCTVYHISGEGFHAFLNSRPDTKIRFYESCVKLLVSRLRDLGDDYVVSQYQLWKFALKKEAG